MGTASCPSSYTLCFTSTGPRSKQNHENMFLKRLCCSNYALASPRSCCTFTFGKKSFRQCNDLIICNAFSESLANTEPSQKFAVILQVEGVLMDVYFLCNREAFNAAFKKLGLDCANWAEPVYLDLVRKSVGDEERMLVLYFNRIGWPTSVATNEQGAFMKSVLREKKNALDNLVKSNSYKLTPGAEEFVDDALQEGVPVIILTAYSSSGEKVARSIVEKLGAERLSKITIVGDDEVKQSFYGQLVFGKGVSSSLDEQLAKAVSKAASAERQRIAEEVASMLKLKVELINNSSESLQNIVAALRAGAEYAQVSVDRCVLVAGSQSGVAAAERIDMPCVVLRSSSTTRAEFRNAMAVMDGFGGPDLSIPRLRKMLFS